MGVFCLRYFYFDMIESLRFLVSNFYENFLPVNLYVLRKLAQKSETCESVIITFKIYNFKLIFKLLFSVVILCKFSRNFKWL